MTDTKRNFMIENGDPATGVSICIPRVFNNIGYRRIKQVFINLQWGHVERVDVVSLGEFKRAFVHFTPGKWRKGDAQATAVLAALKNGEPVKIVYDAPWYWKIGLSRAKKPSEAPKPRPRAAVVLGAAAASPAAAKPQPLKIKATRPPRIRTDLPLLAAADASLGAITPPDRALPAVHST